MRKLCSKWVQRLLTVDQKQRVDDLELYLSLFQRNKKESLRKYVTMDKIWIHHFTLESNRPSAEWTAAGESHPKQSKTQTSNVFSDAKGILFIDYLEKGRSLNSKYYIALLVRLKEEITKKRPQMKKKKCIFTKTMYRVISRLQGWQNYMNCTLNCFRNHPILQIWPQATTGCSQTTKELYFLVLKANKPLC